MTRTQTSLAKSLFAPLGPGYERWARILSLGQDERWRRALVNSIGVGPDSMVLDIAAGTGSITRLLGEKGATVVSLDQSPQMLNLAVQRGATGVVATAESLPFPNSSFDAVTFGYLLRYVDDVERCMAEIARVIRPGGCVGMLEFGRPVGMWGLWWWCYTRLVLPAAGLVAGRGWYRVGRFLGPSIDDFVLHYPTSRLETMWRSAGFVEVQVARHSLGGGLVMRGRKG